ncbi:MAG: efflux RND transporter periplasmic adaptor subunit [Acidobacteriota bacterium]|nr:efflux RND transporter periplasmic adaptor subunit [Acidobacteriota bacterium]
MTKCLFRKLNLALVLGVAALVVGVALSGCKKEGTPQVKVTVQAEKPESGPMVEHLTADALLAPIAQAAIEPKISAPVKKFYVQRGDKVREGQLLAVLENADLTGAAMDSKGSFEAAQAAYVTATQATVPAAVQRAQLDFNQAEANLNLNEGIVKSRKQLFAQGAIPGRDLDTAEAALVQAKTAYEAAKTNLESMQKINRQADLKAAKGQLTSAEGKLKSADAMVNYSEIRSPIDGVVTERPLYAGETAAAGTPLITVMETSTLLAKAHLAQSVVQNMKLGDTAKVSVAGIEKPVNAIVSLISPALDPGSTTVEVWLKIDNKSGALKVGTPVNVVVTGRRVVNALKIPQSAVLTAEDGTKSVMVIGNDGAAHRKQVTLGIVDGDDVQVLSGLSPTDEVITSGSYGLDDGTPVVVGPAATDDDSAKPNASKSGSDD